MIALTASLAFILVAGPQETCMASDTACRVRELERRVEALERRLGGQAPSAGVQMTVSIRCYDEADCLRRARAACTAAGFTRGLPTDRTGSDRLGYTLTRLTCID